MCIRDRRKLGLAPARTMQLAQRLYEGVDIGGETVGLITYMRTDGVDMDGSAIAAARRVIGKELGEKYVPNAPRKYTVKARNAQKDVNKRQEPPSLANPNRSGLAGRGTALQVRLRALIKAVIETRKS